MNIDICTVITFYKYVDFPNICHNIQNMAVVYDGVI